MPVYLAAGSRACSRRLDLDATPRERRESFFSFSPSSPSFFFFFQAGTIFKRAAGAKTPLSSQVLILCRVANADDAAISSETVSQAPDTFSISRLLSKYKRRACRTDCITGRVRAALSVTLRNGSESNRSGRMKYRNEIFAIARNRRDFGEASGSRASTARD